MNNNEEIQLKKILQSILGEKLIINENNKIIEEDELLHLSENLLRIYSPSSIVNIFPEQGNEVKDAISKLKNIDRFVIRSHEDGIDRIRIDDLLNITNIHNLIVAPGGTGKTYVLWKLGKQLLNSKKYIPILINLSDYTSAKEVREFIEEKISTGDINTLINNKNIVFLLDGWSEYPNNSEKRKLLGMLGNSKIIAASRYFGKYDDYFNCWKLENIPVDIVISIISTAFPSLTKTSIEVKELLQIPLILILYLLLGGNHLSKGELIKSFHEELSENIINHKECFYALCRCAARIECSHKKKLFLNLYSELKAINSDVDCEEIKHFIKSVGTLGDGIRVIQPVHDIYWEWIIGCGLLKDYSNLYYYFVTFLSIRNDIKLAIESGEHFKIDIINNLIKVDILFVAIFIPYINSWDNSEILKEFSDTIRNMFNSQLVSQKIRGIYGAILSKKRALFYDTLETISDLLDQGYSINMLNLKFDDNLLWDNRDVIEKWLIKHKENYFILDAIQHTNNAKWGSWIKRQYDKGILNDEQTIKVILGCIGELPEWVEKILSRVVKKGDAYYLNSALERGDNIELARWIFANYKRYITVKNNSMWYHFNQILLECGDDELFDKICSEIVNMQPKVQELLLFMVTKLDDKRIARVQIQLFDKGLINEYYKLKEKVNTSLPDNKLKEWLKSSNKELECYSWCTLAKKYQNNIIDDLIINLPSSFNELHYVPELIAMKYLDSPPERLVDELWRRLNGTIQPKLMEDFIYALSKNNAKGIPSMIGQLKYNCEFLPIYHLSLFLDLLKEWQKNLGIIIKIKVPKGEIDFSEFLTIKIIDTKFDDPFLSRLLEKVDSKAIINHIIYLHYKNPKMFFDIIKKIGCIEFYDERILLLLLSLNSDDGLKELFRLFSDNLNIISEEILKNLFEQIKESNEKNTFLKKFVKGIAVEPKKEYINLYSSVMDEIMNSKNQSLDIYKYMAEIISIYEIETIKYILDSYRKINLPAVIFIIRFIEKEINRLIIDEENEWICYDCLEEKTIIGETSLKLTYENLLEDIIFACSRLQGRILYEKASENDRNSYITDILEAKKYIVKDQALWGKSNTGKKPGELDIFVLDNNRIPFSIIESLNLSSVSKDYLNMHLDKIFSYDLHGLKYNFIVVFYMANNFSSFWENYYGYIYSYEYKYKLEECTILERIKYADIRVAVTTHTRENASVNLYHICVKLSNYR